MTTPEKPPSSSTAEPGKDPFDRWDDALDKALDEALAKQEAAKLNEALYKPNMECEGSG
jgi:hypothetical protein